MNGNEGYNEFNINIIKNEMRIKWIKNGNRNESKWK